MVHGRTTPLSLRYVCWLPCTLLQEEKSENWAVMCCNQASLRFSFLSLPETSQLNSSLPLWCLQLPRTEGPETTLKGILQKDWLFCAFWVALLFRSSLLSQKEMEIQRGNRKRREVRGSIRFEQSGVINRQIKMLCV